MTRIRALAARAVFRVSIVLLGFSSAAMRAAIALQRDDQEHAR